MHYLYNKEPITRTSILVNFPNYSGWARPRASHRLKLAIHSSTNVRRIKTTFIHARPAMQPSAQRILVERCCIYNQPHIYRGSATKSWYPRRVTRVRRIGCITRKMRDKIAPCAFHTPRVQFLSLSPRAEVTFLYLLLAKWNSDRSLNAPVTHAPFYHAAQNVISHSIKFFVHIIYK